MTKGATETIDLLPWKALASWVSFAPLRAWMLQIYRILCCDYWKRDLSIKSCWMRRTSMFCILWWRYERHCHHRNTIILSYGNHSNTSRHGCVKHHSSVTALCCMESKSAIEIIDLNDLRNMTTSTSLCAIMAFAIKNRKVTFHSNKNISTIK